MEGISWRLVLGVCGVVIALWQIHDKVYANDMRGVDAHFIRVDGKIMELVENDKSDVILAEIKNNRKSIDYMVKLIDGMRLSHRGETR